MKQEQPACPATAEAAGEWHYEMDATDEQIMILSNEGGILFWVSELAQAKRAVNAHNAALRDDDKSRFFALWRENDELKQDTKRLIETLEQLRAYCGVTGNMLIDAAMLREGK